MNPPWWPWPAATGGFFFGERMPLIATNKAAIRNYRAAGMLYHVSWSRHHESIQEHGLVGCDDGWLTGHGKVIFFLTDPAWVYTVARDIGAVPEFDVWGFWKPALRGVVVNHDDIGDLYSTWSFYAKTPCIPRHHLAHVGRYTFDADKVVGSIRVGGEWRLGPVGHPEHQAYMAAVPELDVKGFRVPGGVKGGVSC